MRKALFVVLVVVLSTLILSLTAFADGNTSSAGMSGIVEGRHFAFTAVETKNGVKGHGVLTFPEGPRFQFTVDCLNVEGNVAIVAGYLTSTTFQDAEPGNDIWFKVVDNGEGAGSAPDRSTFFYFSGQDDIPSDCYTDLPEEDLFDLQNGNVNVNP